MTQYKSSTEQPIIFSKNYISGYLSGFIKKYDNITCSSNNTNVMKANLFDRNKNTKWLSSGESTDKTDWSGASIIINFYEGGNAITRTIDRLLITGCNLKRFKLQYDNGSGLIDISETIITNNDNENIYIEFATKIGVNQIKLIMDSTIVANQEKEIAELMVMEEKYEFVECSITYPTTHREKSGGFELADGTLERWQISEKFGCSLDFEGINQSMRDSLRNIFDNFEEFFLYPEPSDKPGDIYLGTFINVWGEQYSYMSNKNFGYNLQLTFQET